MKYYLKKLIILTIILLIILNNIAPIAFGVQDIIVDYNEENAQEIEVTEFSNENEEKELEEEQVLLSDKKELIVDELENNERTETIVGDGEEFDYDEGLIYDESFHYGEFEYIIRDEKITLIAFDSDAENCEIPSYINGMPVTQIGMNCFRNNTTIKNIKIPNTVVSLSEAAFSGCSNLENIELSENIGKIRNSTFYACFSLSKITIPQNLKSIESYAFYQCSELTYLEIPNSVTQIGEGAFLNCQKLKSIRLPDSITEINEETFRCCFELSSIVIPNKVSIIKSRAFQSCRCLQSIEMPDSVARICSNAFEECFELKDVKLSNNLVVIEKYAFFSCDGLHYLTIPESVREIHKEAFGWGGLKEVTILSREITLGEKVFRNCVGLKLYGYNKNGLSAYCEENNIEFVSLGEQEDDTDDSKKFIIGRDNNSFIHHYYSGAGFEGVENYLIDDEYLEILKKGMTKGEKANLQEQMNKQWNGSCYGIAVTIGMVYEGYLKLADISNSNAQSFFELPKPRDDKKLLNTIDYFHLSQGLSNGGGMDSAIAYIYPPNYQRLINFIGTGEWTELPEFLKAVVDNASKGHALVLTLPGHAILITNCEYDEENDQYIVYIYDENTVKAENICGYKDQMRISKDYKKFKFRNYNENNYGQMGIMDLSKIKKLDINNDGRPKHSKNVSIQIPIDDKLVIKNSSGEKLISDGNEFSGDMKIYSINTIARDLADGSGKTYYNFEVDSSETFIIEKIEKDVDVRMHNDDSFMSLEGEKIDKATINLGQNLKLEGNDYNFKAFVSTNEEVAENENNLMSISADATKETNILINDDKVEVKTEGSLNNIETGNYIGNESDKIEYEGEKKEITIENTIDFTPQNELSDINISPYIFNSEYYADMNKDLKDAFGYNESALIKHYLTFGIKEGRQASPIFNPKYYLKKYNDLSSAFGPSGYEGAYYHFINYGVKEGREASKYFSVKYYLNRNLDVKTSFMNNYTYGVMHFAYFGISEGRIASEQFNVKSYYNNCNNYTKNKLGKNYIKYYALAQGGNVIVDNPINIENYMFDSDLYYNLYPDLQKAIGKNSTALKNHYLNFGLKEGRIASYVFDSKYYLNNNSDLKKAFGAKGYQNAYNHFVQFGINEGRTASKYFNVKYYLDKNLDLSTEFGTNYSKALAHFVEFGINEGRKSSAKFDVSIYRTSNKDLNNAFGNNWKEYFKHYIIWGQKENRKCV